MAKYKVRRVNSEPEDDPQSWSCTEPEDGEIVDVVEEDNEDDQGEDNDDQGENE